MTTGPDDERNPVWSPDGRSLFFSALEDGQTSLHRKGLRAGDLEIALFDTEEHEYPESWSPEGSEPHFVSRANISNADALQTIWALSLEEGSEPEALLSFGFPVDEPQVSPDGRWLA